MIRLVTLVVISILLVGCNNTEIEGKVAQTVEEAVVETKTEEQYIEEFKIAMNYDVLVAETENSTLNAVDVDGDSISEIVLVANEDVFNAYVATFRLKNNKWIEMSRKAYTSTTYIQLSYVDKLQYQDSSKAAFVIGVEEAGAGSIYKDLNVFMYDEVGQKIKQIVRFPIDPEYNAIDVVKDNQLDFKDLEGNQINYEFQDGQFIDSTGQRLGAIVDEDLVQLLGTKVNDYYFMLNDSYEEAVEKVFETPELKQDSFGADCAFYDSFYICDGTEVLYDYYITPLNEVSVAHLESYFKEPILIERWINQMEDGYLYTANINTPDAMYNMEFDSDSPNAKLKYILVSLPTEGATPW